MQLILKGLQLETVVQTYLNVNLSMIMHDINMLCSMISEFYLIQIIKRCKGFVVVAQLYLKNAQIKLIK